MLSKKMAFSLMSLITLLALAFAVPSAMAAEFEIKIAGPTAVDYAVDGDGDDVDFDAAVTTRVKVSSDKPIANLVGDPSAATLADTDTIKVYAFNKAGFMVDLADGADGPSVVVLDLPKIDPNDASAEGVIDHYAMKTPSEHQLLVTITPGGQNDDIDSAIQKVIIEIQGGITSADPTLAAADAVSKADAVRHTITLSEAVDTTGVPQVVSIQRLRPGSQAVVSAFQEEKVTGAFDVRFVLTEAHSEYDADKTAKENADRLIEVENGVASALVVGVPFLRQVNGAEVRNGDTPEATSYPNPIEGMYDHELASGIPASTPGRVGDDDATDTVPVANSDNWMYRQYRVTITPHTRTADFKVKVRIKPFHDGGAVVRRTYQPPGFGDSDNSSNGREILTVDVKATDRNLTAGYKVVIPKEIRIPGGGYLVIAQNAVSSEVVVPPGSKKDAPKATERTPAQMIYNVIEAAGLPNLATAFQNGVVVDVQSPHAGLIVSEVMWGEDVSLNPSSNSQYIELYNPGADYVTADDANHTPAVNEALTLVFYAPNEFSAIAARTAVAATATTAATTALPAGVTDRIGTLDATGAYWNPAGKGQSGRSGTDAIDTAAARGDFVPVVDIVSMYRAMVPDTSVGAAVGAMKPAEDGQVSASWMTSAGPKSANFNPLAIGIRHGTPGAATDATDTPADTAAEAKAKADAAAAAVKKTASTGTMPEDGQIYISEIMFAGGGILPQWIEISNGSRTEEINLSGWTLTVDNAAADADVSIGASATFTIADGTTIDMSGQQKSPSTILVVTEARS